MTDQLSLATLGRVPAACRPGLDPRSLSVGIVHLGLGAFHRAHQAVYTEEAAERSGDLSWGICGVSERSPEAAESLGAQDGLYTVLVAGPDGARARVVASLRGCLFAQAQGQALLELVASPAVRVVTITVSERGYRYNTATRHLSRDDPEIGGDAAQRRPPVTVVGQLARGLEARRRRGSGPVTVVPCDNIPSNGQLLERLVAEMLEVPGAQFDTGLREWVDTNVRFPCTMVDRIVPRTTPARREQSSSLIGLADSSPVVTEPFSQWVVEEDFAAGRPAWHLSGAQLVDDVEPYEALKLRTLNGSHSALAYLGQLAGCETIAEALARPELEEFVRAMTEKEVRPTLTVPAGTDFGAYRQEVWARFANTALPYRCAQVALDGSQKLPQRLLGTLRDRLAAGSIPVLGTTVVAAWLVTLGRGTDDGGKPIEVSDPLTDLVRGAFERPGGPDIPGLLAQMTAVFGPDLVEDRRFVGTLRTALAQLRHGPVVDLARSATS